MVGDSRADLFDCFYFNLNGDGKFVGVVLIGFGRIEDWRYYSRWYRKCRRQTSRRRNG